MPSWLVDGHADLIDVVDVIKEFKSPEGVALHLRILFSGNKNAEAVFEINNPERAICDDDAVGGTEALFYPAGEVNSLLNQDNRISAGLLCGLDLLQHEFGIAAGAVVHLFGIPGKSICRIVCREPQHFLKLELRECMSISAFRCVVASFILVGFAEPCRWRTVNPSVSAGCGKDRVLLTCHFRLPPRPS